MTLVLIAQVQTAVTLLHYTRVSQMKPLYMFYLVTY